MDIVIPLNKFKTAKYSNKDKLLLMLANLHIHVLHQLLLYQELNLMFILMYLNINNLIFINYNAQWMDL